MGCPFVLSKMSLCSSWMVALPASVFDSQVKIEYLKNNPSVKVRINGHTDNVGSDQQNLMLSKKRARFIANKVIEKGIRKTRVKWKGFGESSPIADNNHAKGE